jgi:outer membrane protein assembly factor BamB
VRRVIVAAIVLSLSADLPAARAQERDRLPGEQPAEAVAARRLAAAADLARQGEWGRAWPEYLRLLASGGDLVPHPEEPGLLVPVRRLVYERLSRAPDTWRDRLRRREEPAARRLYEEGRDRHDPGPFHRLLDTTPLVGYADAARDALGDLLFERGRYAEAVEVWKRIDQGPAERDLVTVDRTRVRVKRLLALWFAGRVEEFWAGWQHLARTEPEARGRLGLQEGRYVDLLRGAVSRPPLAPADDWTTTGGNPERNAAAAAAPPALLGLRRLHFRPLRSGEPLAGVALGRTERGSVVTAQGDRLAVLAGGQVELIDLTTGARRTVVKGLPGGEGTLTWAEGCVVATARDGRRLAVAGVDDPAGPDWQIDAPARGRFRGTPLVLDGRLYVAEMSDEPDGIMAVVCRQLATGHRLWGRDLARGRLASGGEGATLALAGHWAVLTADLGVTAAVDVATGEVGWLYREAEPGDTPAATGLGLCLAADGAVFAVSGASGHLRRHAAEDGRVQWQTAVSAVRQLVALDGDRLIVATVGDLRALDTRTGAERWRVPAVEAVTAGRSVVAGGWVFWPTSQGVRVLEAATGRPALDPQLLDDWPTGDVAVSRGRVFIATPGGVTVGTARPGEAARVPVAN